MDIYLIRHTQPAIEKGMCYGQSDLDITASFYEEAAIIQKIIPDSVQYIYSSPLQRCKKLADHLFPEKNISLHPELMELNCGKWEMQLWDEIPKEEIDPWMNDFVNVSTPGGESYVEMFARVTERFEQIVKHEAPAVIVSHGGVIRSILAHITNTPLIDSFKAFGLAYGCVVKLQKENESWRYEVLSNIRTTTEQHKPKR